MDKYIRPLSIGTAIGGIAAVIYLGASYLPASAANEQPLKTLLSTGEELFLPQGFDADNIVKFNDDEYLITADPGVSLKPVSTMRVRKIEYGKVSVVTIAKTTSGIYSSEGLTSPHFRYPGVHVEKVPDWAERNALDYLAKRLGWEATPAADAQSFQKVTPNGPMTVATLTPLSCAFGGSIAVC